MLDGPHAGSDGPLDAFHAVDVRTHVRSPVRCGLHDRTDLLETGRPPAQGDRRGVRGADISVSRRLGDQRTAGEDPRPRDGSRVDGLPQPERGPRRRAPWLQPRRSVESASATAWAYISPVPASSMVSILLGAKIMCQCASDMPGMRARPSASIRRAPSGAVGGSSEASEIFDPVTRTSARLVRHSSRRDLGIADQNGLLVGHGSSSGPETVWTARRPSLRTYSAPGAAG